MASHGRAALCAALVHAVVVLAGCGRVDYDRRGGGSLDGSMTVLDGGAMDGGGGDARDADLPDAVPVDAAVTDAATDASTAGAFDGLQGCTSGDDCPSGSCWGRWCVPSCAAGCGTGFECLSLPSSAFSYCLPRCDRVPAGCPADAPCNGSVCEPTCGTGGACPGSTFCMGDTCSGD